jgi:NTE family protein
MTSDGKKIGVALSGGGYRAAAYHLGTLRALHKLGVLENVDVVSAVSGGSIIAAYYVLHKNEGFDNFEKDFRLKLSEGVIASTYVYVVVLILILITLLIGAWLYSPWIGLAFIVIVIALIFGWYHIVPISSMVEHGYKRKFFGDKAMTDLPASPLVAINTTDVSTGTLFTFSQKKMSGYKYLEDGKLIFDNSGFPISKAVMASTCVPFAFNPVRIPKRFCKSKKNVMPLLIDGGIYDNQGAHKFSERNSEYKVGYAIVSDAGNTTINSDRIWNPICLLVKTSDLLMNRIKTFQRGNNNYSGSKKKVNYAYTDLSWDDYSNMVNRFVKNIKCGYIPDEVVVLHNISAEDVLQYKCADNAISQEAYKRIVSAVEMSIGWSDLLQRIPTEDVHKCAYSVGTNLKGLTAQQIDALVAHSEWMTEVQVKLHLPNVSAK